ncbi:MAG TPA: nucleoside monophosphate kinase, partial [Marisediminicola sp.]|nr:nucleoside monophosphate kinase [Marisediminicola sp.]
GYPRTLDQVSFLDDLLETQGRGLDAVIQLLADTDEVVARLRMRAHDQGRSDDSEEAIRHRQEVFARETAPIVAVYKSRGQLIEVDGLGEISEVGERIITALAAHGIARPEAASAS